MELKYRSFNIDEFARDERFREWVIERDPSAEKFWTAWLAQNPDRADKIQVARAFLLALEEEMRARETVLQAEVSAPETMMQTERVEQERVVQRSTTQQTQVVTPVSQPVRGMW